MELEQDPASLAERLEEVMQAMGWLHADVMRISGQTSSVVSQWRGKGSKDIKTIGKLEAAIYLERASGYSCLWIAKGMGPKMVPRTEPSLPEPMLANLDMRALRVAMMFARITSEADRLRVEAIVAQFVPTQMAPATNDTTARPPPAA